MKEDFLHYIWKHQLVATKELKTTQKENIIIKSAGNENYHAGPDFFNAQLQIGKQLWAGNVEIHIKASDWYVHGHEKDKHYDTVILHVVWEHDVEVYRKDNSSIPTLQLKEYVDKNILNKYQQLFATPQKWINCEKEIASVDIFLINSWLERLYIERLEQKSILIQELLHASKNDWEAVLFTMLSKNFGLKVNGDAFLKLASTIDFSIIRKERHRLESMEALFFGQAGLLNETIEDAYYQQLQKEYHYLQKKYTLKSNKEVQMLFFRLRPNNFPTIRIAQLAALVHQQQNLFSKIMATKKVIDFYTLFEIAISPYWKTHYTFTSVSKKYPKKLSTSFIDLTLINTVIPLQFMYLKHIHTLDEEALIAHIKQLKPERNAIIDTFKKLQIKVDDALQSQALLQLKNKYCTKQRCLQCAIGNYLING